MIPSRRSIQSQLIPLVIGALSLLALVLIAIASVQQQNALVQANRERSLTISSAVNNTIESVRPLIGSLADITELDTRLAGLVGQNTNVSFIAVTWVDGDVIFHSDASQRTQAIPVLANLPADTTVRRSVPGFGPSYLTTRLVESGDLTGPDHFQIVVGIPAEVIDAGVWTAAFSSLVITGVAVIGFGLLLIAVLRQRLVRPIGRLSSVARAISGGNLALRANIVRDDEIGTLAGAFNSMTEQLSGLIDTLEARVAARTRDLQVAADVAKQVTTVLDIDALMEQVVWLVRDNFDLYACSIFLLEGDTLVEAAGTVSLGTSAHEPLRIALHTRPSPIALAACSRDVIISNEVGASERDQQPETLPGTRAQLSIPLAQAERVLGVFDLQSDSADRFDMDDIGALVTLAEQITVAVRNAQLFAEAKAAREVAEEASQLKSRFLAAMSHELRTPMNAILNFTEFVADGFLGPVNEEQAATLGKAIESGEHLLSLINDILDVSKIEAGMMQITREEVDLNGILERVLDTVRGLLQDKPVELRAEIEADLPNVAGDRRRIRQILTNLLANAVKFTESGYIMVTARHADGTIQLAVQDTGVGIAPADQALIFDSFRQTRAGLAASEGTGLGLSITRYLVEAHGGHIWVESAVGAGSTFYVTLPISHAV
ncbi:MAG: HAMP domain-containing protein [Anaerolineae bacterium]|nr:HAMP domain-containing protein [Anaerolineae bacterium]